MNRPFANYLLLSFIVACTISKHSFARPVMADTTIVLANAKQYFIDCNVTGSIAIYDNTNRAWHVSDTVSIHEETLPASTFKIINLLIVLETNTINNENDIVQWPGATDTVKYGYRPDIYHDMTVKEAFEVSAGWVFIELAKKIGRERYKQFLDACGYGNGKLSQQDHDFWNFGTFGISPENQVVFLKNLYYGKLPFSKRNIDIVKQVMINEQSNRHTIRAKTGWTRDGGINTGWWVGYVESGKDVYFFATRLLQDRKYNSPTFGTCRTSITTSVLRSLGIPLS